jgi:aspartate-semialdehyde dehydrogenase
LYLFASQKSEGVEIKFKNKMVKVLALTKENIGNKGIKFALFSAGSKVSKEFAPIFVENGAVVIDNSSYFRQNAQVPLVVPEVNPQDINWHSGIIANPNCSTIQAVVALAPLNKEFKIKRIVYSTYQAVSGAGKQGIDDLLQGQKGEAPKKFTKPIYLNVIPHIDEFLSNGYTKEEMKMVNETRKILGEKNLKITATCVRVCVLNSHSESINVEFKKRASLQEIEEVLKNAQGVIIADNPSLNIYPTPLMADNKNQVFVGRIRLDEGVKSGVNLWVVADNIRKGAATNAVQILELLINKAKK